MTTSNRSRAPHSSSTSSLGDINNPIYFSDSEDEDIDRERYVRRAIDNDDRTAGTRSIASASHATSRTPSPQPGIHSSHTPAISYQGAEPYDEIESADDEGDLPYDDEIENSSADEQPASAPTHPPSSTSSLHDAIDLTADMQPDEPVQTDKLTQEQRQERRSNNGYANTNTSGPTVSLFHAWLQQHPDKEHELEQSQLKYKQERERDKLKNNIDAHHGHVEQRRPVLSSIFAASSSTPFSLAPVTSLSSHPPLSTNVHKINPFAAQSNKQHVQTHLTSTLGLAKAVGPPSHTPTPSPSSAIPWKTRRVHHNTPDTIEDDNEEQHMQGPSNRSRLSSIINRLNDMKANSHRRIAHEILRPDLVDKAQSQYMRTAADFSNPHSKSTTNVPKRNPTYLERQRMRLEQEKLQNKTVHTEHEEPEKIEVEEAAQQRNDEYQLLAPKHSKEDRRRVAQLLQEKQQQSNMNKGIKMLQQGTGRIVSNKSKTSNASNIIQAKAEARSSEQRRRTRLSSDLTPFHLAVLSWNIQQIGSSVFEELQRSFQSIPLSFTGVEEYQSILFPLLLEECRAGMEQAFIEMKEAVGSKNSKSAAAEYVPLVASRESVSITAPFHYVNCKVELSVHSKEEDAPVIQTDDLLLLWPYDKHVTAWHQAQVVLLAVVEKPKTTDMKDKHGADKQQQNKGKNAIDIYTMKLHFSNTNHAQECKQTFNATSRWNALKVMTLRTFHREYQALYSCEELLLNKALLQPKQQHALQLHETAAYQSKLKQILAMFPPHIKSFNESQQSAIANVLCAGQGFSLIQGPPGTGKTKTIIGLVNMLYLQHQHRSSSSFSSSASRISSSRIAQSSLQRTTSVTKPFRILICAPSNAAIDEIVDRLEQSILNEQGKRVKLSIVRVGAGNQKQRRTDTRKLPADERQLALASLPFHERCSLQNLVEQLDAAEQEGDQSTSTPSDANTPTPIPTNHSAHTKQQLRAAYDALSGTKSQLQSLHTAKNELEMQIDDEEKQINVDDETAQPDQQIRLHQLNTQLDKLKNDIKDLFCKRDEQRAQFEHIKSRHEAVLASSLPRFEALRLQVLRSANIVCSTLSAAALEMLVSEDLVFKDVIIDEAAQSSEISALIPLKYNCRRAILVGDPRQLSSTVLSQAAVRYAYRQSLFERLEKNQVPVNMLQIQYRMHWEIRHFPSIHFYGGLLRDAESLCASLQATPHPSINSYADGDNMDLRIGPYVLYNVAHGKESHSSGASISNVTEADFALCLFQFLMYRVLSSSYTQSQFRQFLTRVGIISPYRSQVAELKRKFTPIAKTDIQLLEIDSVDAMQGREKDWIILSCVRAHTSSTEQRNNIGFLKESERLNVALTRARLGLYVLVNVSTVQTDPTWKALVENAKSRSRIIDVPRDHKSLFDAGLFALPQYMRYMEPVPYENLRTVNRPIVKPVTTTLTRSSSLTKSPVHTKSPISQSSDAKSSASKLPAKPAKNSTVLTSTSVAVGSKMSPVIQEQKQQSMDIETEKVHLKPKRAPECSLFANEQKKGIVTSIAKPLLMNKTVPLQQIGKMKSVPPATGVHSSLTSLQPAKLVKPVQPTSSAAMLVAQAKRMQQAKAKKEREPGELSSEEDEEDEKGQKMSMASSTSPKKRPAISFLSQSSAKKPKLDNSKINTI